MPCSRQAIEALYRTLCESERESKELLLEFGQKYPYTLKGENIDSIINAGRSKRSEGHKDSMLAILEVKKRDVEKNKQFPVTITGHDKNGEDKFNSVVLTLKWD